MQAYGVIVVVLLVAVTVQGLYCPPPFFVERNGECVAVIDISDLFHPNGRRLTPVPTCPYCSRGVYDIFPNWDNCSSFFVCLDGYITDVSCQRLNGQFYNPTKKDCELFPASDNICVSRDLFIG